MKMTLFVDMDEVLADTYGAHVEIYNKGFNAALTLEECFGKEAWQCVPKEHQQSIVVVFPAKLYHPERRELYIP